MSKPPKLSDSWSTPQDVFDEISKRFGPFDLDVASSYANKKAPLYLDDRTPGMCGLTTDWHKGWNYTAIEVCPPNPTCWMNPPYSNITPWLHKAREESKKGCTVIALINYDHTTKWWKTYIEDPKNDNKCYPGVTYHKWPTRISFDPPPGFEGKVTTNTRPSVVVVFRPTGEK